MSDWIRITATSPSREYRRVLLHYPNGHIGIERTDILDYWLGILDIGYRPTHWQPLPEPPEMREADEQVAKN